MRKIVSINYFEQRVDLEGLNAYKETEEYTREVEAVEGDQAFAQLQDMLESRFTTVTPVAESTGDVVYDYYRLTDYGITLYLRDNYGDIPVVRFKFDNATLTDADRKPSASELELARYVIEVEHLDSEVAA